MPVPLALAEELQKKLIDQRPFVPAQVSNQGPPINLAGLKQQVTNLSQEDKDALISAATSKYDDITAFIQAMNPYGTQVVMFPNLKFESTEERAELDAIRKERGIEIAGWLRKSYSTAASMSSDAEMTLAEKAQCFYWDFRYPEDPSAEHPRGGPMLNLQITKAIRIPFIYRRSDGELLLGHILIGFEGAGSM